MSARHARGSQSVVIRSGSIVFVFMLLGATVAESLAALPLIRRHRADVQNTVRVAGLTWHTDYVAAYREARNEKRMLLINFVPLGDRRTQRNLDRAIRRDPRLQEKLQNMVLARLPEDHEVKLDGRWKRLIDDASFQHLAGRPGITIVDLAHDGAPFYGCAVTALPFSSGKYYRWQPSHLRVAVDLPPGTITQRTMIWAVRTHPESPASTLGDCHPALAEAAAKQSDYQARIGVQGHHNWNVRFHQVSTAAGAGSASEVVAESWPNQDLIDSCVDCVQSWRQSPGHWGAVRRRHRLFGYDIRRGRNGIWYGTGIFAN